MLAVDKLWKNTIAHLVKSKAIADALPLNIFFVRNRKQLYRFLFPLGRIVLIGQVDDDAFLLMLYLELIQDCSVGDGSFAEKMFCVGQSSLLATTVDWRYSTCFIRG